MPTPAAYTALTNALNAVGTATAALTAYAADVRDTDDDGVYLAEQTIGTLALVDDRVITMLGRDR